MTRALVLIVVVLSSILLPLRPDGLDRAEADVSYIYDALGRLVAVVDSASNQAAIYRYDEVGNLTAIERQSASVVAIIEFNPKSGPVGTTVTIYGTGFSATASQNTVGFNGTAATVTSATATQIVASVPAGATTGPITVTAPGGSATSSSPFIVGTPGAPTITSFAPTIGTPGTPVTITGTNFETALANNRVRFNNVANTLPSGATATTISASVPSGTGSGRISVTTPAGSAVSPDDFFIPPPPSTAADVEVTGRMSILGGNQTVTFGTANKIALIVFDASAGQRTTLRITGVTILGSTLVAVDHPNGTFFTGTYVTTSGGFLNLTLPTAGTYTIRVDPSASNVGSLTLTLGAPDLTHTTVTAPVSARAGQAISISWTVSNQGTAATQGTWVDYVYLSTDQVCCTGDTLLTSVSKSGLAVGSSYTETRTVTVPNTPAGTYYLLFRTDSADNIFETNDTNNQYVQPISVTTPDLTPTALTAPSTAAPQQAISISWTAANQGTGTTQGTWVDYVYFSADQTCCTGDTILTTATKTSLAAGSSYTETKTITVPNVSAGTYYIILRVDHLGGVYEANEGNNERQVTITVSP
jgi:YD repeat-containing protein